jgi:hypothetical protein
MDTDGGGFFEAFVLRVGGGVAGIDGEVLMGNYGGRRGRGKW